MVGRACVIRVDFVTENYCKICSFRVFPELLDMFRFQDHFQKNGAIKFRVSFLIIFKNRTRI